jgi:TetR/AcrR family transcriptional repressor of nem operon
MRYEIDHKQKTRERVLTEAAKAIRAEGPHRVAVSGVMAKAGLTHGGFYAHFASKDDLVAAAIDTMFGEAKARFARDTAKSGGAEAAGDSGRPQDRLTRYIDFYLSAAHRDARTTGCPLPALAADLPRLAQASRERYGEGVAALTQLLAEALAALDRPDAPALATSALAEMVGALSLARAVADPAQSDAILNASRTALKRRLGLETAQ